jgi:predicted O-methyltransferase YrrM
VGHDERPLLLRRDGTIGSGGGDAERFWFVRRAGGRPTLVIGSETTATCELHLDADGVWRGRWLDFERMPIELAPHRSQVLLDLLGDRRRPLCGAEIGVFEGFTSAVLLRELPRLRLWMVDTWAAPQPGERYWQDPYMRGVPQPQMDLALHKALEATDFARDRRVVMIADLAAAAAGMADGTLDFVFCDADHSAEGTLEAIETWWPKLRPGGLLAGHDLDYPGFPGVREAVEETARRRDLPWSRGDDYVWYFCVPT